MISPIGNQLLIELVKHESQSGILLTDQNYIIEKAKVLEVGPLVKDIKQGQTVLFKSYAIDVVNVGSEEYVFVPEPSILAVEHETPA